MDAKELRLGNKFLLPNGDIGTITYHEIRLLVIATEKPDYKPIILTEEWLLKMGFGQEGRYIFRKTNSNLSSIITVGWTGHFFTLSADLPSVPIIHVHQIQNLYYALMGEELQVDNETVYKVIEHGESHI